MKKFLALTLAALFAASVQAAEQLPLFNATLTVGKEHRFVLLSQPAGKSSGFLALGQNFDGYMLKAFDAKTNTLDLERDGKVSHVMLMSDAAIANAPAGHTPATIADAKAVMDKMHIEELLERTIEMQKKGVATMMQRNLPPNVPEDMKADFLEFQGKIMDEVGKLMDPQQMKSDITRIYSETFSKEELGDIAAFYDTPLGQTVLQKQPEIQQKMQEAMIPRMAQLGPKIQQMSRDFGQQMQAKRAAAGGAAPAPAPAPAPGK